MQCIQRQSIKKLVVFLHIQFSSSITLKTQVWLKRSSSSETVKKLRKRSRTCVPLGIWFIFVCLLGLMIQYSLHHKPTIKLMQLHLAVFWSVAKTNCSKSWKNLIKNGWEAIFRHLKLSPTNLFYFLKWFRIKVRSFLLQMNKMKGWKEHRIILPKNPE